MSKIDIVIRAQDAAIDTVFTAARLRVSMGVFTYNGDGAGIAAASLISADTPNDLKVGSDNKLLSRLPDNDFLADYILASN